MSIPVALYTAVSESERISFNILNRVTGNRVRRDFVVPSTNRPVEPQDQVKGYELEKDQYVILEPSEIAAAIPESDKLLAVSSFIACDEIDPVYFDKPYYLGPVGPFSVDGYSVIREAMKGRNVGALARAILFKRIRTVLIRPDGDGLIAHTLHFDYEVRSAAAAFEDIPPLALPAEMLDLAKHIIRSKAGTFDPRNFVDRYDGAVSEVIKAKMEGRRIVSSKPRATGQVIDLMEALRASAAQAGLKPGPAPKPGSRSRRQAAGA